MGGGNGPKDNENECEAGNIDTRQELGERDEGPQAVMADGECHRAKRPQRCGLHDEADHRKH